MTRNISDIQVSGTYTSSSCYYLYSLYWFESLQPLDDLDVLLEVVTELKEQLILPLAQADIQFIQLHIELEQGLIWVGLRQLGEAHVELD